MQQDASMARKMATANGARNKKPPGSRTGGFFKPATEAAGEQQNYCAAPAAASSAAAAFIDSFRRPRSSVSSTFTRTCWPSFR